MFPDFLATFLDNLFTHDTWVIPVYLWLQCDTMTLGNTCTLSIITTICVFRRWWLWNMNWWWSILLWESWHLPSFSPTQIYKGDTHRQSQTFLSLCIHWVTIKCSNCLTPYGHSANSQPKQLWRTNPSLKLHVIQTGHQRESLFQTYDVWCHPLF